MATWRLQQVRGHFSKIVKKAMTSGSQNITVKGKPAVVVISQAEFQHLCKSKQSFVEFIRDSPLVGLELDLKREIEKTL